MKLCIRDMFTTVVVIARVCVTDVGHLTRSTATGQNEDVRWICQRNLWHITCHGMKTL